MGNGVPYAPIDVHLDDKFELIEAEFGVTGFAVVVKLFQKIYGEQGYYCEWTREVALLFSRRCGLGGSVVSEIVLSAIKRGIFCAEIFDRYGVLTSAGVQKRFFKMVRRRECVEVEKCYLLVPRAQIPNNVHIIGENVYIKGENVDGDKQGKVTKGKVNKGKGAPAREALEKEYGAEAVALYIGKAERYSHTGDAALIKAELWLAEDTLSGKLKRRAKDSFDIGEYERQSLDLINSVEADE